jgi:hypothetical protein
LLRSLLLRVHGSLCHHHMIHHGLSWGWCSWLVLGCWCVLN